MTINLTDPANQLTAEQLVTLQLRIMSALSFYRQSPGMGAMRMAELLELAGAAASELQERRKAAEPELKPANLINKFYERYPVASFKSDTERAAALGYFMAGAELQCFGEFVKYEDMFCDE